MQPALAPQSWDHEINASTSEYLELGNLEWILAGKTPVSQKEKWLSATRYLGSQLDERQKNNNNKKKKKIRTPPRPKSRTRGTTEATFICHACFHFSGATENYSHLQSCLDNQMFTNPGAALGRRTSTSAAPHRDDGFSSLAYFQALMTAEAVGRSKLNSAGSNIFRHIPAWRSGHHNSVPCSSPHASCRARP